MTDAVDTATTTVSGEEGAQSQAADQQQSTAADQGQQQAQQQQEANPTGVPESYQFTYPDGYKVDDAALGEATGVFKEIGLTQEQAQKLVEYDAKRMASANSPAAQEAAQRAAIDAHSKQVEGWVAELKSDAQFGGAKFEENIAVAQKAMAAYGSPELSKLLNESGMGSHPLFVKLMHKVGQELGEGKLHRTTTEQPSERSLADRMYPNYGNN